MSGGAGGQGTMGREILKLRGTHNARQTALAQNSGQSREIDGCMIAGGLTQQKANSDLIRLQDNAETKPPSCLL